MPSKGQFGAAFCCFPFQKNSFECLEALIHIQSLRFHDLAGRAWFQCSTFHILRTSKIFLATSRHHNRKCVLFGYFAPLLKPWLLRASSQWDVGDEGGSGLPHHTSLPLSINFSSSNDLSLPFSPLNFIPILINVYACSLF